jgi:hypothetical protein
MAQFPTGVVMNRIHKTNYVPVPLVATDCVQPLWDRFQQPDYYNFNNNKVYTTIPLEEFRDIKNTQILDLIELSRILPTGAVIAGGSVSSAINGDDLAGDIDIFFTTPNAFEDTYAILQRQLYPIVVGYVAETPLIEAKMTPNKLSFIKFNHTIRKPIQLIKMIWYESIEHVIDSFDFTVTQFAIANGSITCNPMSLMDLCKKKLVVNRVQNPIASLRRLIKYTSKGYIADSTLLLSLAENIKISELDEHDRLY